MLRDNCKNDIVNIDTIFYNNGENVNKEGFSYED